MSRKDEAVHLTAPQHLQFHDAVRKVLAAVVDGHVPLHTAIAGLRQIAEGKFLPAEVPAEKKTGS